MAVIKRRELKNLNDKEREEKLKELKMELIKAKVSAGKSGKAKIKEIKKTISRILTLKK
jgi:ribosomal protein L29